MRNRLGDDVIEQQRKDNDIVFVSLTKYLQVQKVSPIGETVQGKHGHEMSLGHLHRCISPTDPQEHTKKTESVNAPEQQQQQKDHSQMHIVVRQKPKRHVSEPTYQCETIKVFRPSLPFLEF